MQSRRCHSGLRRATWQGHYDVVKLLLEKGAKIDGWQGEQLLVVAQEGTLQGRSYDVMKLFIQSGAKISGRD